MDANEPPPDFRAFDRGNRSQKSGDRRSYPREAHRKQPIRTTREQWGGHIFDDEDVAHFINLYDGYTLRDLEIRVPFMIRVNGESLGDIGVKRMPASTLDVLPTLLGLLDIDYPSSDYHG